MGFTTLLALVLAIASNRAASEEFRHLRLGGDPVKWRRQEVLAPVRVTYAIATKFSYDDNAIHCGGIGPVGPLVEGSELSAKMFTDALQLGLRRWERVANIVFVQTTDEDSANILVGAQLRPRGIAYTDVSLSDERSGKYRLIERARVCLNPERSWMMGFDGKLDTYDLVHTLTHELGHAIGLDHPNGRYNVMSLQYRETLLSLSVGDIKGVRGIYGAPQGDVKRQQSQLDVRVGALR